MERSISKRLLRLLRVPDTFFGQSPAAVDRRFVVDRIVVIGVCLAVLIGAVFWQEFVAPDTVVCPARGILGIPCPACGLTRACCALVRGDVRRAVEFNALCLPLLALLLAALVTAAGELAQSRRWRWYQSLWTARTAKCCLAALLVFHLVRLGIWLSDGTLFDDYLQPSWLWRTFAGSRDAAWQSAGAPQVWP